MSTQPSNKPIVYSNPPSSYFLKVKPNQQVEQNQQEQQRPQFVLSKQLKQEEYPMFVPELPHFKKQPSTYVPPQKRREECFIQKPTPLGELKLYRESYLARVVIPKTKDAILEIIENYKLNPIPFISISSSQLLLDNGMFVHHQYISSIVSLLKNDYQEYFDFKTMLTGQWFITISIPVDLDYLNRIQ